jgi:hypothetical protein
MHSIPAAFFGSASPASPLHLPAFLSATGSDLPGLLVLAGFLALAGLLIHLWMTVRQLRDAMRALEKRLESPAPVQPPPEPVRVQAVSTAVPVEAAPAAPARPQADAIDEGVLTAIAAAVAMVFKQPHRIIAIQPDAGTQHAWSSEGRRELYHSHRIR